MAEPTRAMESSLWTFISFLLTSSAYTWRGRSASSGRGPSVPFTKLHDGRLDRQGGARLPSVVLLLQNALSGRAARLSRKAVQVETARLKSVRANRAPVDGGAG